MLKFLKSNKKVELENLAPLSPISTELVAQDVPRLPDKYALTIQNVLTEEECQEWIRVSESRGYQAALVSTGYGREELIQDYRHSSRCIIDDPNRANEIFLRIRSFLPQRLSVNNNTYFLAGLNERLRFLKYDPGDFFAPHMDGTFCRSIGEGASGSSDPRLGEISLVTFQLYLNGGFSGGETSFFPDGRERIADADKSKVVPETGLVLLFEHRILHEGSLLVAGVKYAVRTDVMYTTRGPGFEYTNTNGRNNSTVVRNHNGDGDDDEI